MEEKQVLRGAILLTAGLTLFIFFIILLIPQVEIVRLPEQYRIVTGMEINYYVDLIMKVLIVLAILGMAFLSFFGTIHAGAKEEK
ncbi:MAG: hypothetical protein Q8O41_07155 [Candidatus Methanoperedens sp.]|nr:hypothetical protein [Candidatus Methanoperedens sp.]